ncbi:phage Mu protein gp47-like protein [Burkholderia aenigmatica]|uniref:Phage Mu protein gp47-like protein n=1 Tax=Burkholderia aenigmatica TaxID=2015348 RepID=A0A6P2MQN8_9BURK|nr:MULTISPECIES: baseplate J/gp47 family protein [Burkholderia]VWB88051.1 phage Mu protein gp47-like protein [Burkholderia aenigmatica]
MPTSATSSVPSINWAPTGPVAPAESAILTGTLADINAAFGGKLNIANADGSPNLSSPQGQIASSMAAIVAEKNDDILEIVNGVDPDLADGRFQDAIGRIYFIERNPAQPTTIQVACVGLAGTVIPVGAQIADANQNVYLCQQAGTIPASGTITLSFAAKVTGPTAVPGANQISVYQAIPGWDTVSVVSGVIGNVVESRADFETRRRASVALNSRGSIVAVRAAVLNVANVLDAYVTDNPTSQPFTIGDFTLAPHSLYVGVYGGAAQDIAQAIWTKKSPGCNYNGNTTVTVYDTSIGSQPYPAYDVTFQTLTPTPIFFVVQLVNNVNLPSNFNQLVKNAIISASNGSDGGPRARSGSTIYSGRYFPGLMAIDPSVEPLSVQMGFSSGNQNSLQIGIDQTPTVDPMNISVILV